MRPSNKNIFCLKRVDTSGTDSGTLPGEVLVLFTYIQSELMNVCAGVGYEYSQCSSLYTVD